MTTGCSQIGYTENPTTPSPQTKFYTGQNMVHCILQYALAVKQIVLKGKHQLQLLLSTLAGTE